VQTKQAGIMPYTKILIYIIWATKRREKIISNDKKILLIKHITENSVDKKIFIDTLNCVSDHIHLLISLSRDQTISNVVRSIKGESSHWWNTNSLTKTKFQWQNEYIALSVSESIAERVRKYILRQEEHHKKRSFTEEYSLFIEKAGLTADSDFSVKL